MPGKASNNQAAHQSTPPGQGRRDQVDYRMPTVLLVATAIGAVLLSQV